MKELAPLFVFWALLTQFAHAQPPWTFTPTNTSGVMLGQATVNGQPAAAGDWVGAFDPAGNCAGAAEVILNGGLAYFNLPIYGDDPTTTGLDEGMTGAEGFSLRIWQATTGAVGGHPTLDNPTQLTGWSNTNGAPMPGYDDPEVNYSFGLIITVSIVCPPSTCVEGSVNTAETFPTGGTLAGPGITGVYWDPAAAGIGVHTLSYTIEDATATCTVEVTPTPDATILTTGPYCANASPIPLAAESPGGAWSGDGVIGEFFDPTLVNPGNHSIAYNIDAADPGCAANDQATLTIYPAPAIPVIVVQGDELLATNTGPAANAVSWQTLFTGEWLADGVLFTTPQPQASYVVLVTNAYGCTSVSLPLTYDPAGLPSQGADMWEVWADPSGQIHSSLPHTTRTFDLTGRERPRPLPGQWNLVRLERPNGDTRLLRVFPTQTP